jgi:hypothetical protein
MAANVVREVESSTNLMAANVVRELESCSLFISQQQFAALLTSNTISILGSDSHEN